MLFGIFLFAFLFTFFLRDLKETSNKLEDLTPSLTTRIYDFNGKLVGELFTEKRDYVEFSKVPEIIKKAFLASEDERFYSHPGIDFWGIIRALWQDIVNLDIVEGASTITQQLSRSRFLTPKQVLDRKIKEIFLALMLEKKYTKDQIFEAYLNQIYLGHGFYGIKAAAKAYFGKELQDLNLAEVAMLVGIARSPSNFSPYVNFQVAQRQQRRVLQRMKALRFITEEEFQIAISTPIVLSGLESNPSLAPHFIDYLLKELTKNFDERTIFSGGLKIYTTLDANLQKVVNQSLQESEYEGAILCMDPRNGYLKAMVGGRNYQESKFNRAVQAYRQPGSTFKPFIYAASMDSGFTPSSVLVDEPLIFPNGWKPQNYEKKFRGPITLREALEGSVNIVGIKLLQNIGIDKVINYARKMGVKSQLRRDLSLALGTSEMTLLELVTAYCAFANEGMVPEPVVILRVENSRGQVLYENKPSLHQALSKDTAYIMARLLQGVIERGTARRANIGRPAGGKTGTTEDFIDAWFIGFTPDLVCGIYLGHDDRTPLGPKKTGGIIAAPIFAKIMKEAHKDLPVHDFVKPEGIVELEVCLKSGLLPGNACKTVKLPFKRGTTPQEVCNRCP
ncbi:MAG: penicillin-binding protein 1A [Candidatus Caldatribacteriaceae bacterium]